MSSGLFNPKAKQAASSLSVSELVRKFRSKIEQGFASDIKVVGEISNMRRYPSGHTYFSLKDDHAEIPCIMFASDLQNRNDGFFPDDGVKVQATARPSVYEPKGRLQLKVSVIEMQGTGNIHAQFLKLKKQLLERGWFDAQNKQPLPQWPQTVGVVASSEGAAWRDVSTTLAKRFPCAPVMLFTAPAQGAGAAAKIAAAIRAAAASSCDVLIVCRGGGSLEDLWAYNEIEVAQAIYEAKIPIVAGIGHETDETIADYVADVRAPTPTAAAAAAVPDRAEILKQLAGMSADLLQATSRSINTSQQRLDDASNTIVSAGRQLINLSSVRMQSKQRDLANAVSQRLGSHRNTLAHASETLRNLQRVLASRSAQLRAYPARIAEAVQQSMHAASERLQNAKHKLHNRTTYQLFSLHRQLKTARARLDVAGPGGTLKRGYALVLDSKGDLIKAATSLSAGQKAQMVFADGKAAAQISSVKSGDSSFLLSEQKDD